VSASRCATSSRRDDGEGSLWRPRAHQRGHRGLVALLLDLGAARVANRHLALLVRRGRLLDAEPLCPRGRLPVVEQDERAEQRHRVGVELRFPPRERGAEVEVAAAASYPRFVVPLPLLAPRLLLRVVAVPPGTARCLPRPLRPILLRRDVRGDLLGEAIREPLRVGHVAVVAAVHPAEFEEAAEGARGVGGVVIEGEALALASLLLLAGPASRTRRRA
jgi:hypothetical protein